MNTFGGSETRSARPLIRGLVAAASATLVALSLVGCTPAVVESSPEASPAVSPSSAPSESAAPAVEPLVIPSCEELLPLSVVADYLGDTTELLSVENTGEFELTWPGRYEGFEDFLAEVPLSQQCTWAPAGSFEVFVGLMVADTSNTDLDALRAQILASGYETIENDGVETYVGEAEGSSASRFPAHVLIDDLWIYTTPYTRDLSLSYANSALEEIRAANPTRGY